MRLTKIMGLMIISVVLTCATLAGCASKGANTEDTNKPAPGVTNDEPADLNDSSAKDTAASGKKEINLYTWEGYVPDDVVADFTDQTGIKINYSYFNDNDEMFSKLKQAKGMYDVIICSDYIIETMRLEGGLIKKLDKSKLPNFKNTDPAFQKSYYDPDDEYAVPYAGAAALLVWDSAKIPIEITSYADLWRSELKGAIWGLDSIRDMLGITLLTMNESVSSTDAAVIKAAGEKLMALKPNMAGLGSQMPDEALIGGEATVGYMFGSQAYNVAQNIPTLKYCYPSEGFILYVDNIVLAENAPHEEYALQFINYLMDGQVAANVSNQIFYPATNLAAQPYLSEEFKTSPYINIPGEALANHQGIKEVGDATVLYGEIWTEFKSN